MDLIWGIILGLAVLVFLVVVHELGHAIAARRNGVVVEEFGIGFPPRAWKKKLKNKIVFSLNWLPLGGFVKLQGENDSARGKGDYGAATFWQKTKIILAGVLINWIVAAILFTGLAFSGLPKVLPDQFVIDSDATVEVEEVQIASVAESSPAEEAGLKAGDEIIRFAEQPVEEVEDIVRIASDNAGEIVTIIYDREGVEYSAQTRLNPDDTNGHLGAGLGQRELITATWSAPIVGVGTTAQFTYVTLQGLGDILGKLFSGLFMQLSPDEQTRERAAANISQAGDSVAGPIGILGSIFPAAQSAGLTQIVFLMAIISLTLATINALPIPALDGGRWTTMTIFRLLKKKLTKEREETIQGIGFLVLMGLIILVTIADVGKLF
jgi:regulator of sigma E protease